MPSSHQTHDEHDHQHAPDCGHTSVQHGDHVDYVHDGHLHRTHSDHIDECRVDASGANPETCTQGHACTDHDSTHRHGKNCGHESIPHGGHVDYLVEGHLHHAHDGHCDDHGPLAHA
jgi:hypothetical protein